MTGKLLRSVTHTLSFLIISLFLTGAAAQQVEWASTGTGINEGFFISAVDANGNLTAVTEPVEVQAPKLYDISGEVTGPDNGYPWGDQNVVVSYSPQGYVMWALQIEASGKFGVEGVAKQGSITALLIDVEDVDYDEDDEESFPTGTVLDLTGEAPVRWGLNMFFLDSAGSYVRHVNVFESAHREGMMFSGFVAHPDGGFAAAVSVSGGLIALGHTDDAGKGGADLMMKISPEGKLETMRVIKHLRPQCCIGFTPKIAVSPDGTIYIAGHIENPGIDFGGGVIFSPLNDDVASTPHMGDHFSAGAYLASYTASGELNWVKTVERKARLKALAADAHGVVLALDVAEGDRVFGRKIERSNASGDCIATFKPNGKLSQIERTSYGAISAIDIRPQEGLYYAGMPSIAHTEKYGYSRLYLARLAGKKNRNIFDRLFSTRFAGKPTHELIYQSSLAAELPYSQLNIHAVGESVIIAGRLYHGKPTKLNEIEPAFGEIEMVRDRAPFVLKISTAQ